MKPAHPVTSTLMNRRWTVYSFGCAGERGEQLVFDLSDEAVHVEPCCCVGPRGGAHRGKPLLAHEACQTGKELVRRSTVDQRPGDAVANQLRQTAGADGQLRHALPERLLNDPR